MKVESCAPFICLTADALASRSMMEPAAGVRLVRRFVLREADVAVDPEHRSLGIAAHFGREAPAPCVELADELTHRLSKLLFIRGSMCFEPRLVVVAHEPAKKAQGGW